MELLELPDELIQSVMLAMDIREYCDFRLSCRVLHKLSCEIDKSFREKFYISECPKDPVNYDIVFDKISYTEYRCHVVQTGYRYDKNSYHGLMISKLKSSEYYLYAFHHREEDMIVGNIISKEIWRFGVLIQKNVYDIGDGSLIYSIKIKADMVVIQYNIDKYTKTVSYYSRPDVGEHSDKTLTINGNTIRLRYLRTRFYANDTIHIASFENGVLKYKIKVSDGLSISRASFHTNGKVAGVHVIRDNHTYELCYDYDGHRCSPYRINTYPPDNFIIPYDLISKHRYFRVALPRKN
jgi:hypothetical protein